MLKNMNGFSALEAMVAIAIAGIAVLGSSSLMSTSGNVGARAEKLFWLEARRIQIQGIIRSQAGWDSITGVSGGSALNPGLNCYLNGTSCAAYTTAQNLKIPIDNGLLDGSNPSMGMDIKGNFCTTFDANSGNPRCPIGVSLKWQILCDNTQCLHGQPKVTVQFRYNDSTGTPENLNSYNLIVYKDAQLESLNEVCTSMGGTLNGMSCTLSQLSAACSPSTGSFVIGFDPNGTVLCGRPNPGSCASSEAGTGFDANGGLQCAPACP